MSGPPDRARLLAWAREARKKPDASDRRRTVFVLIRLLATGTPDENDLTRLPSKWRMRLAAELPATAAEILTEAYGSPAAREYGTVGSITASLRSQRNGWPRTWRSKALKRAAWAPRPLSREKGARQGLALRREIGIEQGASGGVPEGAPSKAGDDARRSWQARSLAEGAKGIPQSGKEGHRK